MSPTSGSDASSSSLVVSVSPGAPALCTGACVALSAQATGGNPPYSYKWIDGLASDGGDVTVCPISRMTYTVTATDSSGRVGELTSVSLTSTAKVTVTVAPECSEAGLPVGDGGCGPLGSAPFASGHYVGAVYCPPDGGVINLPTADGGQNSGTVTLDLSVNGTAVGGSLHFLWSLGGAIAWQTGLDGALDCSKRTFQATWENAEWGLPTTGPDGGMTIVPTGSGMGSITATPVSGSTGTISGNFDFVPASGGFCDGTYTATLEP